MTDDDDWFERALREDEEDADDAEGDDAGPGTTDAGREKTDAEPEATDAEPEATDAGPEATGADDAEPANAGDAGTTDESASGFAGADENAGGGFGDAADFGAGDDAEETAGEFGLGGLGDDSGGADAEEFGGADPEGVSGPDTDGFGGSDAGSSSTDAFSDPGPEPSGGFGEAEAGGDSSGGFGDAKAGADSSGGFGDADSDAGGQSGGGGLGDADADDQSGGFADADPYDDDEGDGELFDQDFASAFESAPGGGGGAGAGPDSGTGDGGFGGGGGGEFGMGGSGGEFGMGGGGGFGGDGEPFGSDEFDDEEFESDIPRIDLGIEGLDDMIQGGVPERSLITTIGSAGTGKTTFGLQFLHEALEQGESAVYITLEESHDRIVSTATEKGWDFDEYEAEDQLAVIDIDPIEMANSLTSIRNDLPRLVEDFGATRLVLDSVSLLEMMYDEQATRRNEVYDFTKSLKEAGVTTMLTSEASEDTAYASRHGIIEYLVDAVFILRYVRSTDDFRETRMAVEIQKIRDANHSREIKPYSITNEGINVYRQANIF